MQRGVRVCEEHPHNAAREHSLRGWPIARGYLMQGMSGTAERDAHGNVQSGMVNSRTLRKPYDSS